MAAIKRMTSPILALVALVMVSQNVIGENPYNQQICDSAKGPYPQAAISEWKVPDFEDNFHVIIEKKFKVSATDIRVVNWDLYYSQQFNMARLTLQSTSRNYDIWAIGEQDVMVIMNNTKTTGCTVDAMEVSRYGDWFFAIKDGNGSDLGYPSEVLKYAEGLQESYFVKQMEYTDRGIFVNVIFACLYDEKEGGTIPAVFYFSDPTKTTMPGTTKSVLVRADYTDTFQNASTNAVRKYSHDYTHFEYRLDPLRAYDQYKITQGPYCDFSGVQVVLASPLIPDNLEFRVMSRTVTDQNLHFLERFKYTYLRGLNLFVQETVRKGGDYGNQEVSVLLQDFNAGVQFELDRVSGSCNPAAIEIDSGPVFIQGTGAGQTAKMNNGQDFFGLPTQANYQGQFYFRGIEADGWSVKTNQYNIIYYFADNQWTQSVLFNSDPLPIGIELYPLNAAVTRYYDIFDYTTDVSFQMPDLTDCFDLNQLLSVQFVLQADFHTLVAPDVSAFRRDFILAVMENTQTTLASRIPKITYFPWSQKETMVQVTIVDKLVIDGVSYSSNEPTNSQAYNRLKNAVDSNQFVMTTYRKNGQVTAKAKPGSFGKFNPKQGSAARNAAAQDKSGSDGTYSAGSMVGLAIGMIILTASLTLVIVFLLYKFKFSIEAGGTIRLSDITSA